MRASYNLTPLRHYNLFVPATLIEFARVNDTVAATSSKLKKQSLLADYLRSIDTDDDLRLAARNCAGRVFAATDERVLGASGSIVGDVLISILKLQPREFWTVVTRNGEIGEALAELWHPSGASAPLTLDQLYGCFLALSATGNQQRKREIVRDLFSRCTDRREAAYLAKIIFSDLRTGVREGVLQAAVAQAFGKTLPQIQRAQLLVGDLDEVAVLARHDRLADAQFKLFHPIQFMLATPQESSEQAAAIVQGKRFCAEDKLDGIRAQVHKLEDRIAIYTRTLDRIDESFPDVVESLKKVTSTCFLDGEIVPYRDGVVLPFAHIQKRLGRKSVTAKIIRENPAVFIAFDILYFDGELLMDRPLHERRAALERLDVLATTVCEVSDADQIQNAFQDARQRGNEGLVLKDLDSVYAPGRRGQAWLKIKTHLPTFDCVVTAAEYGHGKRRGVLSDYTFAVWDRDPTDPDAKLVNIGKAYSGVTDEEIAQLTKILLELSIAHRGHVHQVQPKIVLEIACDQIQRSDRHASGFALRFPRIKRIRWDKKPDDADRLDRIIEIFASAANTARGTISEPPSPEPTLFD